MKHTRLLVLLLCAGCMLRFGPGPDSFEPAKTASGIRASIALANTAVQGELLEVRDTAIVILATDRVALIPYDAITSGAFRNSTVSIYNRQAPLPEDRRALQLLSRYPHGIPAVALKRLLEANSQDSIVVLR